MTEPVKLYIDFFSQPARALHAFCLFNKIPFKLVPVNIMKGKHRTPEFKKLNPFQKIPVMDDNGFVLQESHAILRYLNGSRAVADNWYPKDLKKRALVDRYLDWHHSNTRLCARYFASQFKELFPPGFITFTPESQIIFVNAAFKYIESVFLKDTKFLAGDEISIADLSAACEIMQLKCTPFDFGKFPKLEEWLNRCMEYPEMKEAHKVFLNNLPKPKL